MSLIHPAIERLLQNQGVAYTVHRHADFHVPIQSPGDFAQALGYSPARIAKTLFVQAAKESHTALIVCPALATIDFKQLAALLGWKKATFGKAEQLAAVVGYPSLGVSPLAVPDVPVLVDAELLHHPTILVAAGVVGVEIEINPHDLVALTGATVLSLVQAPPVADQSL